MGELYRPGKPLRPPTPLEPLRPATRAPHTVVLQCMVCGRVFSNPLEALAHQAEHEARGEKPCFRIVEVR